MIRVFAGLLCLRLLSAEDLKLDRNIGPVRLAPGGFLELIIADRPQGMSQSVWTRFERIPLAHAESEVVPSMTHSRAWLDADTKLAGGTLGAYLETDFQQRPGRAPVRFRQAYGEYRSGDWSVAGGQMWSLLRPNRVGITSRSNLLNTLVTDPSYHVGLMGVRDRQVRVTRKIGDWQIGAAWEERGRFLQKVTHDGKRLHWELGGIAGTRGRYGVSAAFAWKLANRLSLVGQQFLGKGLGRDAVGVLDERSRFSASISGLEANLTRRWQAYAYTGVEYAGRSQGVRLMREYTAGVARTLARDKFGAVQCNFQYSVMDRSVWSSGHGLAGMAMLSIRHTLQPGR